MRTMRLRPAPFALLVASLALLCASCSRQMAPPPEAARESLGNVMTEVARRFELAGRAAAANRFELAEFEAGEIEELFESDVPHAELPKEGPTAHIPAMAKTFLDVSASDLKKGAASHDVKTFAAAFERTATACNGCHQASAKGFIQVPTVPGHAVPDVDPVEPVAR